MKFLRIILPLFLLLAMCVSAVACADRHEGAVADLQAHIREEKGEGKGLVMASHNGNATQVFAYLSDAEEDRGTLYLSVIAFSTSGAYNYRLNLVPRETEPLTYSRFFRCYDYDRKTPYLEVTDTLDPLTYTGAELMSFDTAKITEPAAEDGVETPTPPTAEAMQELARDMLNILLLSLDEYGKEHLDYGRADFGFAVYDEQNNPVADNAQATASVPLDPAAMTLSTGDVWPVAAFLSAADMTAESTEETGTDGTADAEDLGPAFSGARISYALRMTLLGMGMVFAVLAILWLILAIFKVALAGKETKPAKEKSESQRAETEAVLPPPPAAAGTDPAVVAAVTAAIAEVLASDPALSEQFAGGFRVVSFKKKSGKASWNH